MTTWIECDDEGCSARTSTQSMGAGPPSRDFMVRMDERGVWRHRCSKCAKRVDPAGYRRHIGYIEKKQREYGCPVGDAPRPQKVAEVIPMFPGLS